MFATSPGEATPKPRGTATGFVTVNAGSVVTVAAISRPGPGTKYSSLPSRDHNGRPPRAI